MIRHFHIQSVSSSGRVRAELHGCSERVLELPTRAGEAHGEQWKQAEAPERVAHAVPVVLAASVNREGVLEVGVDRVHLHQQVALRRRGPGTPVDRPDSVRARGAVLWFLVERLDQCFGSQTVY